MITTQTLAAIILALFVVYSLISKALTRTVLTLPIIFVAAGFLLSEFATSASDPRLVHEGKRLLAEITLILVLFADASHVRFKRFAKTWKIPMRMLAFGLPVTLMFGTIVVFLLNPASGLAMALLTAAVLTPTDAALGQTVVSSPDVPGHLSQTINVESGLNDGLVLPFVLLGAILASSAMGEAHVDGLAGEAIIEVILGPLAGMAVGWFLAKAMDWSQNRGYMTDPAGGVVFLTGAFLSFLVAGIIGGNGFIAAFVGGMVFGNTYRHDIHFITEFMEGAGQLLTMSAFLVFGAFLLPDGIEHISLPAVLVAAAFLTIVRIVPIFVSLWGSGLNVPEKLFLGWFGPRGLASILFTLIIIDEFSFPHEEELLACVSMTVLFSVVLHGISATPLSRWIGGHSSRTERVD